MYGFVNFALEELVLRNFGEEIWNKIKKEAGVDLDGHFMIRVIYTDDMTYSLVMAAVKVLNLPASAILELFGQFFFEFCVESGFDKILSVLGSTTRDFLENLDALHDHLSTIYPGMKAPSFRCTENENGNTVLHYYSERPGLEFIVIGLVKVVALKLHKSEVECKIIKAKEDDCDHVQFEITEKSQVDRSKKNELTSIRKSLEKALPRESFMSPRSFSRLFPFHLIFDRDLVIRQCGDSIARFIPATAAADSTVPCKLTDVFTIIRPHITLDYQSIRSQIMSVFVLCTRVAASSPKSNNCSPNKQAVKNEEATPTRFKGQMVYLQDQELILFLCSPSVMSLDDLANRGMFISDIPMHDASRDLMLMNEHWEEEWTLTQNLEILTDNLQKALADLESEKQKTDNLLYSVLPPSIAQQLRQNKPVEPRRFEQVTLMFCGLKDFGVYCAKYADNSQKIVNMLNHVFTGLDKKIHHFPEIYKVETVGDKYMAVCGLPEHVESHTRILCLAALDIIESISGRVFGDDPIVLTCGINCGEIVTGVIGTRMPRYCLFGDTVNLTSRCETTGEKGKINISEFAVENLNKPIHAHESFHVEYRGEVVMKGKPRPIKMWILTRKKDPNADAANNISSLTCPFSAMSLKKPST